MDEIKEMFFTLLRYSGNVNGPEIIGKLSADPDPHVRKLAEISQIIISVIKGESAPAELAKVVRIFDEFPPTNYWIGIVETSGQVVLSKSLEMQQGETKKEMSRYGVELLANAGNTGFTLNKTTIRLLRAVADADLKEIVDRLIKQNEALESADLRLKQRRRGMPTKLDLGRRRDVARAG